MFIFILSFFSQNISSILSKTAHAIALPFWKSKIYLEDKTLNFTGLIKSREALVRKNSDLEDKIHLLEAKSLSAELLLEENQLLLSMLGRSNATSTIPAFVLARPPSTGYDILVIDQGISSGLKVGDEVSFENILLGFVTDVFPRTSKVKLISSGGVETDAFISSLNYPIKVMGHGWGNLTALVSQEIKVEIGDIIIVPNEISKILGKVEEMEKSPTSSFRKIFIRLPVNLSELKWVSVRKN